LYKQQGLVSGAQTTVTTLSWQSLNTHLM